MSPRVWKYATVPVLLLVTAGSVLADDFRLVPSFSAREEYNDNIFFGSDRRSSFISTLAGGLKLTENTERLSSLISLQLDGLLYSAESSLNGVEQRYAGQAGYLLTPQVNIGANAFYSRESRPDRFIESSGRVVSKRSSHQSYAVNGGAALSEKFRADCDYRYDWTEYQDASISDVEGHDVKVYGLYDLEGKVPRLKLRPAAGFARFRYAGATVHNYKITLGARYAPHELWTLQGEFGARLTQADFSRAGSGERNDTGWVGGLVASYRGELFTADGRFTRDVVNGPGLSGAVRTTAGTVRLSRRFSYELTGSIEGGYYRNYSGRDQFSHLPIDESTVRLAPSLRYEFSRDLAAALSYEFAQLQNHQAGNAVSRNKMFLGISWQKD